MDDDLVAQARRVHTPPEFSVVTPAAAPDRRSSNGLFAKTAEIRFSGQIEQLHANLFEDNGWQKDNGKTRLALESFAWISGDKLMSDYEPKDVKDFARALARIPISFNWGRLGVSGGMAEPFDPEKFPVDPAKIPQDDRRSIRTVNSYLSKLEAASKLLAETYWLPASGHGNIMNFNAARKKTEDDPSNPPRVPWTPAHLRTMYDLPLWQGGGGRLNRVKTAAVPMVYQDAAYWAPLIATYTGLAREEACGLECVDFRFDCEVPYLLVQANMTRSKDGITPSGLKRKSRHRVMPLHPELLRLGLQRYVETLETEGHTMIFPELYCEEAKHTSTGKTAPAYGGRRFYAISWCFIMDATHAIMPLPETANGKKSDFHSQRTYNNSVLASPGVSEVIIADHMGHARQGTGNRSYNRRGLALDQMTELSERLQVLIRVMPVVTDHISCQPEIILLPMIERSRVGSAKGRDAKLRFCA